MQLGWTARGALPLAQILPPYCSLTALCICNALRPDRPMHRHPAPQLLTPDLTVSTPAHLSSLAASGVKSRWLTDPEPAHENNGAPHAINTRAARPGASGDLTSESDDEGRSGSLPPSPRSMLNKTYNMLQECRGVDEFEKISRISEGTYGVVYKVSRLWALVVVSVFSFEPCDGGEYWR